MAPRQPDHRRQPTGEIPVYHVDQPLLDGPASAPWPVTGASSTVAPERMLPLTPRDRVTPSIIVGLLGLAALVGLWAPWRADPPRPLGFSLPSAPPAVLATPAPTAAATVVSTAAPVPTAAVASASRPLGLPLKRSDWVVIRDFAATGGPGVNGALEIGLIGNRDAIGTPVFATQDGTVKVQRGDRRAGSQVIVSGERWRTTYALLGDLQVTDGQAVRKGDQLGTLAPGTTPTRPALSYQVWERVGEQLVNRNPLDFIGPR